MRRKMTELEHHIQTTPLMDTHEHLNKEPLYVAQGPDILQSLFDHYVTHDLISAGATREAVTALTDASNPDLRARFQGVRAAWEASQFTGYGEGVRWIGQNLFGMGEINADEIEKAAPLAKQMHQPGERLRLLNEVANLDHVQIDDFEFVTKPDASGPDFFLYDLSWLGWTVGNIYAEEVQREVDVEIKDLASLQAAFEAIFAKYGPVAIAVKTQHAYQRTLRWLPRQDADAERVLMKTLKGEAMTEGEKLCLGDWALGRGAALAAQYNLPVKIHCGYYAGNNAMHTDYIRAGQLDGLLRAYPQTKFVLMHTSYPYSGEMVALVKHFANTYADMCWAWSIDPFSSENFLRQMIHAVPANKLFVFGGDSFWPHASVAYAWQARRGLTRALQAEVNAHFITETQAMQLAKRFMRTNQEACFDLVGTRTAIRAEMMRSTA
jgi:predicted TIM-barrel fold metal-dependent hydrolase